MSLIQIVVLVIVSVLVISNFIDLKSLFFSKKLDNVDVHVNDVVYTPVEPPKPQPKIEEDKVPTMAEIVEQWDKLKSMCLKAGSKSSYKELDNVFLALLNKEDTK